jgi:hypothetical protein
MTPRRILLFLVCAASIAILGFIFIRNLIDFPVYYSAGQSLISGRTDLYASDFALGRVMDYRYPPLFLVIFILLWLLPYKVAAYIWYLLAVVQITLCVLILRRITAKSKIPLSVKIISVFAVAQYFVMILHYSNAHLLIIFLLFGSLYFFLQGDDLKSAILIALSITIKLTPVLLLPYFVLKKKWRLLVLTSIFFLVLNLIPSMYFGFSKNTDLFKEWLNHVVFNQEFHEINGPINLSLKGQLRRYLTDVDYKQRVDGDVRYSSVNFLSISKENADKAWMVIGVLAYLLGLYLIWRKSRDDIKESRTQPTEKFGQYGTPLELGLMICLMLFVGPLTSKIYFIALLWPVFFLALESFDLNGDVKGFSRIVLIVIVAANLVLPLLPGSSTQRLLLVLGADFYVNLLLMAAVVQILISKQFQAQVPADEQQILAPSIARKS